MSADLIAILACAVITAVLASLGPVAIRRLPEPALESDATDKIPYAELGARPGLTWKLAVAGAVVGGIVGWQLAGSAIIIAWVYLGAVGVVLGYVDAQTRLLPTRIIGPSYLVLVVLTVVAWVIDRDTDDLVRAGLGWLIAGGFYYVMWWIYPRGMGFGDVRLSGLLGIALGFLGWPEFVVGHLLGLPRRRRGRFAAGDARAHGQAEVPVRPVHADRSNDRAHLGTAVCGLVHLVLISARIHRSPPTARPHVGLVSALPTLGTRARYVFAPASCHHTRLVPLTTAAIGGPALNRP